MVLKVCFVGKYPPIQGGVSAQSYWMVRGLAERGHEVSVVTNAFEVEPRFRMSLSPSDMENLEFTDTAKGGKVRLYTPQPFTSAQMAHIPRSNPFVSKLAGLAADVIRKNDCDVIFAYYYEPYGMAAALSAQWTGRPFLIKHAGSDLDRLFASPEIAVAYTEMLKGAAVVVTQPRLAGRFLSLGVTAQALCRDTAFGLPIKVFHSDNEPTQRPFTVGMYGKIGWAKGTFDLISAMGHLKSSGRRVRLKMMIGAAQAQMIRGAVADADVADDIEILELVPNWRVPDFIRGCDAVCFLERDFPVAIHGPIVPREILACGACLILSGDIARNQLSRLQLEAGHEVVVVDDPKQTETLASAIADLMDSPGKAARIGAAGNRVSQAIENQPDMPGHWERVLTGVLKGDPLADDLRLLEDDPVAQAMTLIPELMPALAEAVPNIVDGFTAPAADATPPDIVCAFCRHIDLQAEGEIASALRALSILCAVRVRLLSEPTRPAPGWCNLLPEHEAALMDRTIGPAPCCEIVWVDVDVSGPLSRPTTEGEAFCDALRAAPPSKTCFMITCGPNKSVREMRISPDLADLLEGLGDGIRVGDLLHARAANDAELKQTLMAAIRQLWTRGAIQVTTPQDRAQRHLLPRTQDG
jgi:glycosyltransferase involved in cell wall biosynthesis